MYHHAVCKKFGLFLAKFQNKKRRKEENIILFLYNYIYCLRFMSWFTFRFVCVWFLSTFQYRRAKKKKIDDRIFFSLFALFSYLREFAFWHFINYAYICTWVHVHGRHLKETVLCDVITCSELGKKYRIYKLKRSIPTC